MGATCTKSRLLPCLLCTSSGGAGTPGHRAVGTEQGWAWSRDGDGVALPSDVPLLGPRAVGTAGPTLALQDMLGVLCPPCALWQRAGGACQDGLGLCPEKGLIPSWRLSAGSALVTLRWQRSKTLAIS